MCTMPFQSKQDYIQQVAGMESQTFNLPPEMNNVLSATISDTANGEILFCHDPNFLYAAKIARVGGSVIFQRFNLPNLAKLIPIIKNYFIALFSTSKLVVFEVTFNEDGKVNLKYIFNKMDKPCYSYFLREVVQNMAEVHLFYPDNELFVYQFTINGKIGHMDYVIGPQNKIKAERAQLYGSKTIVCPQRKTFFYLANFSSKVINILNLNKLQTEMSEQLKTTPLTYICLPKIEEHYLILANMTVVNIMSSSQRHKIHIDEEYQEDMARLLQRKAKPSFKISTYFDMILIQDSELKIAMILHVMQKGSRLIAAEYGNFNWFWTSNRKLVGFSPTRNSFKMIDNLKMNKKVSASEDPSVPQNREEVKEQKRQNLISEEGNKWIQYTQKLMTDSKVAAKTVENREETKSNQEKQEEQPVKLQVKPSEEKAPKFVPTRVIQKKGVNQSKILSKPKENEPFTQSETQTPELKQEEPQKVEEQTNPAAEPPAPKGQEEQVEQPKIVERNDQKIEETKPSKQQQQIFDLLDSKTPNKEDKTEEAPQQNKEIVSSEVKVENNKEEECEDSIVKNLALMIQKRSMGGLQFNASTINRNKIFSHPPHPPGMVQLQTKLKHTQSQNKEFYNPLLSQSPIPTRTEEKTEELEKQPYNIEIEAKEERIEEKGNEEVLNKIKQLFEGTTTRLLKTLEDVAESNKLEPYLKENVRREIQTKVLETLRREISGPFGLRLENYFREVLRQTSTVQEESNKFYKEATMHKSGLIEVQLNNQEKILKEIKEVQNMIRFSVCNLRNEGIDFHDNLMREWAGEMKEAKKIVSNLDSFKSRLEEEALQRNKRYEETKKELENIKNLLVEKVNREQQKKLKELELKSIKMQEQEKKDKKKKKIKGGKESKEKEKKTRVKNSGET